MLLVFLELLKNHFPGLISKTCSHQATDPAMAALRTGMTAKAS